MVQLIHLTMLCTPTMANGEPLPVRQSSLDMFIITSEKSSHLLILGTIAAFMAALVLADR